MNDLHKNSDFVLVSRKKNRNSKTYPKRGMTWCSRCDADYFGYFEKCTVCGTKLKTKTRKKDFSSIQI
jgi:hypothetical protein